MRVHFWGPSPGLDGTGGGEGPDAETPPASPLPVAGATPSSRGPGTGPSQRPPPPPAPLQTDLTESPHLVGSARQGPHTAVHVVAAGLRPPPALCSWVAHWLCRPPPVVAPHPGPSNPIQMTLLEHRQGSREWDSAQLACATACPEVACPSQPPPSLAMAPTAPGEVWAEAGLSQDPGTSPRAKLADWVPVPAAHSCTLLSGGSGRGSQCCTSVLGLLM